MLYKNDVIYKLTDKDRKAVYEKLGWKEGKKNKPVVFKIPEEQYTFDAANRRKVRPSRIHIPLAEKEDHDEEGVIRWNYCERPPQKDRQTDMPIYDRKIYPMNGEFSLTQEKIELIWFLLFKSSVRKPNYDENGQIVKGDKPAKSRPCFYVQNKSQEATNKINKRILRAEVEAFILGKNAWPEERIRKYAVAFGCDVSPEDSLREVQADLLGKIEGTPNGYQEFAILSNAEEDAEILYVINAAKKKGVIMFSDEKNAWMFMEDGKMKTKICNGRGSVSVEMALVLYIKDNPDTRSAIEMACL